MTTRICHTIIDYPYLIAATQTRLYRGLSRLLLVLLAGLLCHNALYAKTDPLVFDDTPLKEALGLPSWFKLSFLDLQEDIAEAKQNNRGLIVYFGRHDCAYCKALLETNWGRKDIESYTRQHFDVIAIDVLGHRQMTDPGGKTHKEKDYAAQQRANFTPTLHIYDNRGKPAFKLTGYRPPYQFKAALEYVADSHHDHETFAEYYARAENADSYGNEELNRHADIRFNEKSLDLSQSNKPLLLLFERPRCHACDVLHGGPLQNKLIIQRLQKLHAVQLDTSRDQPIITPTGQRTTSRAWVKQLDLDYTPTLMFFDVQGKEIIRINSVVWFYRLSNVLDYISSKGYQRFPTFQQWRSRSKPRTTK